MLLHLNFCIEWFDSNSKYDSKAFENALNYLKRKKKRDFILLPSFRPVKPSSPPARPQAHHRRGRLLLRAWAVSARAAPRFPHLGPSLASPARARCCRGFLSRRVADTVDPPVRATFFLPTTRVGFLSIVLPIESVSKSVPFLV
jgi:hypothetical protein